MSRSQNSFDGSTDRTHATDLAEKATSLQQLKTIASGCQACDLWKNATQTVFGEGPTEASLLIIGEQPGDKEDLAGHPFVGPAGRLLDECLREAGIDRDEVYVTNAVKHFKWSHDERGKRRIHKRPAASEIGACRPWLEAEIRVVKPKVLLCMGASASQAVLGRSISVTRQRGEKLQSELAENVIVTVHPSSILRVKNHGDREIQRGLFVRDLERVARLLPSGRKKKQPKIA
jgi:uracil-DNA glycosylase